VSAIVQWCLTSKSLFPVNVPGRASLIESAGARLICCSRFHAARRTFCLAGRQRRDQAHVTRIQQTSPTLSVSSHFKATRGRRLGAVKEEIFKVGLYFIIIGIGPCIGPIVPWIVAKDRWLTAHPNVGHVHGGFRLAIVGAASVHGIGAQVIRLQARGIDGATGAAQAL